MAKGKALFILKAAAIAALGFMLMFASLATNNRNLILLIGIPSGLVAMFVAMLIQYVSRTKYTRRAFVQPGWIKDPAIRKEAYPILGQSLLSFLWLIVPFVLWRITGQVLLLLLGVLAEIVAVFVCGIVVIRIRYARQRHC